MSKLPDDLPVFDLRSDHVQNHVRMVQITDVGDSLNEIVEIVIDSGSDASVIPFSMVNAGEYVSRSQTGNSILYDAQGNVMEAAGERKIEVELQGETDTSSKGSSSVSRASACWTCQQPHLVLWTAP